RDIHVRSRRPDQARGPGVAGLRLQVAVAHAAADDALVAVAAVVVVLARLFGIAAVEVGDRGFVVARPGEHVMQVGRAERGAVGAAYEQAVGRAPLHAGAPGEPVRVAAGEAVLVEAAGHAQVERLVQRHAQLAGQRPAVAAAGTVGVLPAVVVVLGRQRIGLEVVGLAADLGGRGKPGRAAGQGEQLGVGQGERRGLVVRLGVVGGAGENTVVLGAGE